MSNSKDSNLSFNIIFALWFWSGRLLGIIRIKFNHTDKRFHLIDKHKFFCYIFGALMIFGFPICYYQFIASVRIIGDDVKFSFSMYVAGLSRILFFISALIAYYTAVRWDQSILEIANRVVELESQFELYFVRSKSPAIKIYKNCFLISVLINSASIVNEICVISLIVDPNEFNAIQLIILMMPNIIATISGNQYVIGICCINYFTWKITKLLKEFKAANDGKNQENSINERRFAFNLQKISIVYDRLFNVNYELEDIYSNQLLFLLLSCFLTIMSQSFYQCLFLIFPGLQQLILLKFLGLIILVSQITNVVFHVILIHKVLKEVSSSIDWSFAFNFLF